VIGVVWIRVDAAYMLSVLSLDSRSYYESWVRLQPDRAARLDAIVAGVVSEFRTALMSNPANLLDPDPLKLPQPFVRYAETLVIGVLHREMGRELSDYERSQIVRAEIMLRTVYTSGLMVSGDGAVSGVVGRPSYNTMGRVRQFGTEGMLAAAGGRSSGVVNPPPSGGGGGGVPDEPPVVVPVFAFFYGAAGRIDGAAAFAAWVAGVPSGGKAQAPVEGVTSFSLAVVPPVGNLVIAYPATIRVLHSAIQQSTGVESRQAWVNGPFSGLIEFRGVTYRVYQWVPAFAWENGDAFLVRL